MTLCSRSVILAAALTGLAPPGHRIGICTCCDDPPTTQPTADSRVQTTQVAPGAVPQQVGQTLKGRVSIEGGGLLQKADLTHVVVYLASEPELDEAPLPPEPATVGQQNKTFVPNFLVVTRGTAVEFPNWDNFDHNVFSRSKAAPAFDLDRYPKGRSKTRVFEKVGVVQVFCNIHPQMRAIIFVTPNRYFARAATDGAFELAGVPAGNHRVIAWHDRCAEQEQRVEITTGEAPEITFTLQESRQSIIENTAPQRDGSYGGVERGLGVKRERLNLPVIPDAHPAKTPEPTPAPPK